MRPQRILVPTDFSDFSNAAVAWATFLAKTYGAELHILHVVVLYEEDPGLVGYDFRAISEEIDRRLDELPGEAAGDLKVFRRRRRGMAAAPAICADVREESADLIVIGTHGRRGFRRFLLGSVAEEVIRSAPCPVLAVHGQRDTGADPFQKVLVPFDFSADSRDGLARALEWVGRTGGAVDVVHVVVPPTVASESLPLPAPGVVDLTAAVTEELEKQVGELAGESAAVSTHVLEGNPAAELLDFAEKHGHDLIVIGSRGLHGIERFLIGSVAERVVRGASCPVLVLRDDAPE